MNKEDACEGYNGGYCIHFKTQKYKCPVPKSAREIFGTMKWCKPVAETIGGKKQ